MRNEEGCRRDGVDAQAPHSHCSRSGVRRLLLRRRCAPARLHPVRRPGHAAAAVLHPVARLALAVAHRGGGLGGGSHVLPRRGRQGSSAAIHPITTSPHPSVPERSLAVPDLATAEAHQRLARRAAARLAGLAVRRRRWRLGVGAEPAAPASAAGSRPPESSGQAAGSGSATSSDQADAPPPAAAGAPLRRRPQAATAAA